MWSITGFSEDLVKPCVQKEMIGFLLLGFCLLFGLRLYFWFVFWPWFVFPKKPETGSSQQEIEHATAQRADDSEPGGPECEVFQRFRGPDSQQGHSDVLCNDMKNAGIRVYRDNKKFGKRALPVSRMAAPDNVKLRTELFTKDLRKHERRHGREQVKKWEDVRKAVARNTGAMDSAPTTASGSSNGTAPYGSHQSNSAERFQHTGPPSSRTADSQSERSSTSTATRKCVACHNSIWMGNAISFLSFHVHQNCFRCQLCSASLRRSYHANHHGVLYCPPHHQQSGLKPYPHHDKPQYQRGTEKHAGRLGTGTPSVNS